jgi:hypothetical protein
MTEDQNKEFDLLQFADDLSYANWQTLKFLYNEKFREAEKRNKELEAALREITESARLVGDYHHVKIARAALGEKKDA